MISSHNELREAQKRTDAHLQGVLGIVGAALFQSREQRLNRNEGQN
ncbi:MAG TPA: hypothetical protein VEQ63_00490 [Bryobacteraceae bacterium]|nr:hypothetical protein [Bryobacteraceae bacterium]